MEGKCSAPHVLKKTAVPPAFGRQGCVEHVTDDIQEPAVAASELTGSERITARSSASPGVHQRPASKYDATDKGIYAVDQHHQRRDSRDQPPRHKTIARLEKMVMATFPHRS